MSFGGCAYNIMYSLSLLASLFPGNGICSSVTVTERRGNQLIVRGFYLRGTLKASSM